MRKIITFIIASIVFGFNNAQAEIVATTQSRENVSHYVTKSIPDATPDEITACYNAVKSGGEYTIERKKIKIECSEEEMVVFRRLF